MKYLTQSVRANISLILLFLLVVAVFCIVYALPVRLLEPDDTTFYVAMQAFSKGEFQLTQTEYFQYRQQVGDLRQYVNIGEGRFVLEKNPFYAFFLSWLHKVKLERIANIILASMALLAFYIMMVICFKRKVAIVSSLILLFDPTFLGMFYRIYMDDFASMSFVLIGASLYFIALNKNKAPLIFTSGFILAVSVSTRYTNVVIYLAILVYTLLILRKNSKAILSSIGWLILGSIVPITFLLGYHSIVLGGIFTTGYSYTIGYRQFIFQFALNGEWAEVRRLLIKNMLTHPLLLIQGFPSILLLPAGLSYSRESRTRYPLMPFLLLWFLGYFLLYIQYMWLRWDSYIYETRFYLPFVPVLSASAGVFIVHLMEHKSKVFAFILLGLIIAVDLGVFSNFVATWVFSWSPVQR